MNPVKVLVGVAADVVHFLLLKPVYGSSYGAERARWKAAEQD